MERIVKVACSLVAAGCPTLSERFLRVRVGMLIAEGILSLQPSQSTRKAGPPALSAKLLPANPRRGGREAEGGGLLNRYTG